MKRILKANWLINTCEFRKQKYAKLIVSALLIIMLITFEGFRFLLGRYINFHVSNSKIVYIFIVMSELLFFPMQIYKQILYRKDEIMLYMAGIERKSIYKYYFLKNFLVSNIIIFMLCRLFLETIIVEWNKKNTVIVLVLTSLVFIEIFLFELFLNSILKKDIYKEIAIIISIEEIISSILLYIHINDVNFKTYSFKLSGSRITIGVIAFEIVYLANIVREFCKSKQVSFYKKNWLLLIRDFDSIKYIIASILLYVIPIEVSKSRPDFFSVIIVAIVFILNIMIVLAANNFKLERKNYVTYYLAMFDEKKYNKEKKKFVFEVGLLATFCLNTALVLTQDLVTKEVFILYAVTFIFCKLNANVVVKILNKLLKYYIKNYQKLIKWKEIFDEK